MGSPIVVHPPLGTGGRRVVVRNQIVGIAYDDRELIELLRRTGLELAEALVDSDSPMMEWRGGQPHDYGWGPSEPGHRPAPAR
ncbi:hypothetical protein OG522_06580 [Streptomyces sp. NBC_01431]